MKPEPDHGADMHNEDETLFARSDETLAADETRVSNGEQKGQQHILFHNGDQVDQYTIEALIGTGGMAQVYKAQDNNLKRAVALKFLHRHLQADERIRQRFLREGQAAAQVIHPNVTGIHGIVDSEKHLYMALELIEGEDLNQLVHEQGPLPLKDALDYIEQAASGLDALANAGIVHRDIKPHNIFLNQEGRIKIGDLGLARFDSQEFDLTHSGEILGTPIYMSPEQVRSDKEIDTRSDIHALGATLYYLLSAKQPFKGETLYTICDNIVKGERPHVRKNCKEANEHIEWLIHKMMAVKADDRFQKPADILTAIKQYRLGTLQIHATQTNITKKTEPIQTIPKGLSLKIKLGISALAAVFILLFAIALSIGGPIWENDIADARIGSDRYSRYVLLTAGPNRIKFREVPAGTWVMGSPSDEKGRSKNESKHKVILSEPIWLAEYECSSFFWDYFSGVNQSPNAEYQSSPPKTDINIQDIESLIKKLNQQHQGLGTFRLPTEAEWEVACRAHSESRYAFGDLIQDLPYYANVADQSSKLEWADVSINDGYAQVAAVGSFRPNQWGFYDMHGNVWEWCLDKYDNDLGSSTQTDPVVKRGNSQVIKGGSWMEASEYARSASRKGMNPSKRDAAIGFRLALSLNADLLADDPPDQ